MKREWKPGDVGISTSKERFIVTNDGWCAWSTLSGVNVVGGQPDYSDRPLVVIDPEDREQVERLRDLFDVEVIRQNDDPDPRDVTPGARGNALQAALREFANPTSDEPTEDGWYAYDGGRQTMIFRLTRGQWYVITESGQCDPCEWGYISQALGVWNLVRVLSEGVTP